MSVEKPRHSWVCSQIEQIGVLWNKRCWEVSSRMAAGRQRSAIRCRRDIPQVPTVAQVVARLRCRRCRRPPIVETISTNESASTANGAATAIGTPTPFVEIGGRSLVDGPIAPILGKTCQSDQALVELRGTNQFSI